MKEKWSLRRAKLNDADALQKLVNSAYRGDSSRQGWTTEAEILGGQRTDAEGIRDLISKKDSVFLLLESSTDLSPEIIASVHLEKTEKDSCYFGMFTVNPELQGRGIGKALMREAEAFAKNNWHCYVMEMTVITVRQELVNWYIKHGYHKTNELKDFPYGDERFGLPLRPDLKMVVLKKDL